MNCDGTILCGDPWHLEVVEGMTTHVLTNQPNGGE